MVDKDHIPVAIKLGYINFKTDVKIAVSATCRSTISEKLEVTLVLVSVSSRPRLGQICQRLGLEEIGLVPISV